MNILKQSTAATIKLGPFVDDTDGKTAETALTIGQADIRLSKNGGDIAQSNNTAGATHDELGYYDIPLDTTDTGTLGRLRVLVSKAGALPVWQDFLIVTANVFDTFCSTGSLNVNAASLSTDAITAASVKADAVTKIQNGLATAAALDAVDNFVDTEVAAILAAVDTEVAAIKAKTDNLPASPAAVGSAMTLTAAYDKAKDDVLTPLAVVDSIVDGLKTTLDNIHDTDLPAVKTETAAIKAKTDNLPATPASAGEYTAAIAAIPTAPLLAANYTAPDNASIATIKAKTNLIPANPAVADEYDAALAAIQADLDNPNQYKADVSALMLASSYVAPNNASITAIKAKTDNLPANTATALAAIQSDLDNPAQYKADVSGLATTAHVQEVKNKIDAIDITVNTIPTNPLLDTAYTAPDNAGIAAIQEKTEQLTFTAPNKVDASADVVLSPEAIENMASAITEEIWSSSKRTLTQSPAEIIATVLGAGITQIRGNSWAVQLTGVELGSIQQLAIKHSAKQSDSAALLFVDSVNGLTVLNGVAQDGEDSSKARLTYDGTILTLTVDASITAQLPAGSLKYGIQSISNNGIVSEPYGGTFHVLADIVRATE